MQYGYQLPDFAKPVTPATYKPNPQFASVVDLYPGLDDNDKEEMMQKISSIPVHQQTIEKQKFYEQRIADKKDKEFIDNRIATKNEWYLKTQDVKDPIEKKKMERVYRMGNIADIIREHANVPVTSTDKELVDRLLPKVPNGEQLFMDYMNGKNDDLITLLNNAPGSKKEVKQDSIPDGTIVGDALGGFAKSATALPEIGSDIGNWIGEKATRATMKLLGYSQEEIDTKIEEVNKRLGGSFGEDINSGLNDVGVNTDSTSFKVGKTIGDTAQILAPTGEVQLGVKALNSISGASKASKVIGKGVQLLTDGAVATQKASLVSDKKLASAGETAAGGVLNLVLGGAIQGIKKIANTNVNAQTKDVLKRTTVPEIENYVNIVKNSKKSIENPTAFEYASTKIDDALGTLKANADEVGSQIGQIRTDAKGMKAHLLSIVDKINPELKKYGNIGIKFTNKGYVLDQTSRIATLPKDELAMMQDLVNQLNNVKKGTSVGDLLNLNKFILNNSNKVERGSNEFKAIIANVRKGVNGAIETAVPGEYKGLLRSYADTQGLLDDIVAKNGQEGLRGETLIRSIFNSNSKGSRDLFKRIKDATGLDLFKEAQLAKFVSESLGDKRGLEMMLGNIKGAILEKGLNMIRDSVGDPIRGAKQIIQGTKVFNPARGVGIGTELGGDIIEN